MTPGLLAGRPRRTLASPTALLEGVGLHSGADASVRVCPALAGAGRRFQDLQTGQEIRASASNAEETARCTVLRHGPAAVQTVEHLLSALAALGIDDCLIETLGGEVPAADGSAAPFTALLLAAGLRDQATPATELVPTRPLLVSGENGAALIVLPAPCFRATVVLDYPDHPWIGTQAVSFDAATDDYTPLVAPARTFGFVRELDWLRARGLALGASRDNAVALGEHGYETPLRFPDELARHKLLDLIGDLSLVGLPLRAQVVAVKPSHALNVRLARLLLENDPVRIAL